MKRRLGQALLIAAVAFASWRFRHPGVPNLHPADVPLVALKNLQADWARKYPERFPMQIAVLWTVPEERGLGLIHSLQQMGLPFFVTRDVDQALRHKLMIIYPSVDGRTFTPPQNVKLDRWVRAGNTMWSQHVAAGGFKAIFGFAGVASNRKRHRVDFQPALDKSMSYLDRPEEHSLSLGSSELSEVVWSDGYRPLPGARVLAHFEDGSGALLCNHYGKGSAYLCGCGLDDVVARPEANRDFEAQRYYANRFEPGADIWRLILRGWYESHCADWVRLATMPDGHRSMLLLSHDVDWEYSVERCLDFAKLEDELKVKSTFFMQTKYLDDTNSRRFFYGKSLDYIRQLKQRGFDLESHSVIHAMGFNHFPTGVGNETFENYRARSVKETWPGGTVYGELRVSRSLLNGEVPGQTTDFFRAGHLRVPPTLPQVLERCGYQFDSSFTADDVMTSFPYPLTRDLDFNTESLIYEFPVSIEDEASPLSERIPQALDVIRANSDNNALSVVLIHSNDPATKVPAERALVESLPAGVVASDMLSFARFWRARDHCRWEIDPTGAKSARVKVQAVEAVAGLTLDCQQPVQTAEGCQVSPDHLHVVLPPLKQNQAFTFRLRLR